MAILGVRASTVVSDEENLFACFEVDSSSMNTKHVAREFLGKAVDDAPETRHAKRLTMKRDYQEIDLMIVYKMVNRIHSISALKVRDYLDTLGIALRDCETLQVLIVGITIFFKGVKYRSICCGCESSIGWRILKYRDGVDAYTHGLR
jgi:hypothetical protein